MRREVTTYSIEWSAVVAIAIVVLLVVAMVQGMNALADRLGPEPTTTTTTVVQVTP